MHFFSGREPHCHCIGKEPDAEPFLLTLLSEVSLFPRFHGCVVPLTSLRLHVRLLAGTFQFTTYWRRIRLIPPLYTFGVQEPH